MEEVKFWDRIANLYDKTEKMDEITYAKIISKAKKYINAGNNVLDFGCGTGLICNDLAGSVANIQAIDISTKMLEIAENKAANRNIKNISYSCTSIFDSRFTNGSFDIVLATYIIHLVDDAQKYLQKIYELLKPGGFFISVIPCVEERKLLRCLLTFFGKLGVIPKIKSFRFSEIKNIIAEENFKTEEAECLHKNSAKYFIAAKKPEYLEAK